jgi:hypothetical protein
MKLEGAVLDGQGMGGRVVLEIPGASAPRVCDRAGAGTMAPGAGGLRQAKKNPGSKIDPG